VDGVASRALATKTNFRISSGAFMNVAELVHKLCKMDQTLPVVAFSYEDGFDDVTELIVVKLEENLNSKDYEGRYNEVEDSQGSSAVWLKSNRRS
jgi:hypothetical protein